MATPYVLKIFQSSSDLYGDLSRSVVDKIRLQIHRAALDDREGELDVWLESPGGDANAAYKLSLLLRRYFKKIRCVIPDYAKSPATLFAFGCDEIYMAADAELGPLDVQIEHPDREGTRVSGLDVAKAVDFLCDFGTQHLIEAGATVYQSTQLPRKDVLELVSKFSASLMDPLIKKLDPHLIHKASNELKIAQEYAESMLANRNLSDEDKEESMPDDYVSQYFVQHFPAHDFVICRGKAAEFGLPVRDLETYTLAPDVSEAHYRFRRINLNLRRSMSIIELLAPSDLDQDDDEEERNQEDEDRPSEDHGEESTSPESEGQENGLE